MQARESVTPQTFGATWFSIVGAPRCGTTSLARYLSSHPDICFSSPKEPHFFSRQDLREHPANEVCRLVREQYLDRFFQTRAGGAVLAEGSVSYLYTPEQMLPAMTMWPDARFILAVRSPLEMLPSLHQRNLYNGDETVRDFARAWSLVEDRRLGRSIPRTCLDARLLDYKEIGLLGKHVRRFFDVVGRDRCFVSVFDDLVAAPREQYAKILDFLGLPGQFPEDFPVHRAGNQVRFGWLQRLLKRPPNAVRAVLASDAYLARENAQADLHNKQGRQRIAMLRKRLLKWNRTSAPPKNLDRHLRLEMCEWFRDDVLELSALVGRDLRHWLAPPE